MSMSKGRVKNGPAFFVYSKSILAHLECKLHTLIHTFAFERCPLYLRANWKTIYLPKSSARHWTRFFIPTLHAAHLLFSTQSRLTLLTELTSDCRMVRFFNRISYQGNILILLVYRRYFRAVPMSEFLRTLC